MHGRTLFALLLCGWASWSPAAEYHVSPAGDDSNPGTRQRPLRTIMAAARRAMPGDVVTVHEGIYRERVAPPRGGASEKQRIVYRAAPGERVEIRGSEIVRGWSHVEGSVWRVTLPEEFFGPYNPYRDVIDGDWFNDLGRKHHTGEVYLNGEPLWEAASLEEVRFPRPFPRARRPEGALLAWYAEAGEKETILWANFGGKNPNEETVEINVRESCFYPDQPGRDFITVRGFRMMHAATQWAAPTAEQIGLIGTHWSRGWIIEDNVISDSRCACITLGKDRATGHNVWRNDPSKDGAIHYNEVIQRALAAGWSRGRIGSHIVRNNVIFRCEQAGIAGSLGAIHSRITGNHIHSVWERRLFGGAEMAGIKIHGAIDVLMEGNRIHNAGRGIWLDWMAQGTRVSRNLLYDNTQDDLFVEVNHGPFLVDNNLLLSDISLHDWSEGGAYVHNLFAGALVSRPELARRTPYHPPHSTRVVATVETRGGDNRFYNNLFFAKASGPPPAVAEPAAAGYGLWIYGRLQQPSIAAGNAYFAGARPLRGESRPLLVDRDPQPQLLEQQEEVWIQFAFPLEAELREAATQPVDSGRLGRAAVSGARYEDVDGRPLRVARDYTGRPRGRRPLPGPWEDAGSLRLRIWPQ
ncbi:MAG: right-handed parallel beta-helix repeat-containing protein [Bryobacteraceae bacterium]|nr:right-handed parallel beta-helix repeat-containing protein [Bryobacteraceae bacterium]